MDELDPIIREQIKNDVEWEERHGPRSSQVSNDMRSRLLHYVYTETDARRGPLGRSLHNAMVFDGMRRRRSKGGPIKPFPREGD